MTPSVHERSTLGWTAGVAGAATAVCVLPAFLTGVVAVELRDDLGIGPRELGVAVGVFYLSNAVSSIHLGRLVDRLGASTSIRVALGICALTSLGIAVIVRDLRGLLFWLLLAGTALALVQPAANRLLIGRVDPERLGTAFGIKQSAAPVALIVAGASIPTIALRIGWRWVFVLSVIAAVITAAIAGARSAVRRTGRDVVKKLQNRKLVAALAIAYGLSFACSASVLAFFVDAAVSSGMGQEAAAVAIALASLAALLVRLLLGRIADALRLPLLAICALLLCMGALGQLLLAGSHPSFILPGIGISLAGVWGYPTIFWLAVTTSHPRSPGRVTGSVMPAGALGFLSPIIFGHIAERFGYSSAWIYNGMLALLASIAMLVAHSRLRQEATRTSSAAESPDGF
jgi:MFS family permease